MTTSPGAGFRLGSDQLETTNQRGEAIKKQLFQKLDTIAKARAAVGPEPDERERARLRLDTILFAGNYRPYWPRMRSFALPSFGDAYLRVNVAGRERDGRVAVDDYDEAPGCRSNGKTAQRTDLEAAKLGEHFDGIVVMRPCSIYRALDDTDLP